MTLIIALGCSDGVIMAAASASTDLEGGTKQATNKLRRIGKSVLFGGSGDYGMIQKVHANMCEPAVTAVKMKGIRQQYKERFVQEVHAAKQFHVPQHNQDLPPPVIALIAGIFDKKSFILELEKNGGDTIYDENLGEFAAIGSGKSHAQAIFRPFLYNKRTVEHGKVLAYRVIDDSINIAAFGLAAPIRISILGLDGVIVDVDDEELSVIATTVQVWREMEVECLGHALSKTESAEPQSIPEPEAESEPS